MTAKEIRIKDLLSRANTQFIIPLYQRNYDWEHKHCKKLFDDIITVGNSNKN